MSHTPTPTSRLLPALGILTLVALALAVGYALMTGPRLPQGVAPPGETGAPPDGAQAAGTLDLKALFPTDRIGFAPVPLDAAALDEARAHLPGHDQPLPPGSDAVVTAFKDLNIKELATARLEPGPGADPTEAWDSARQAQDAAAREFNLRLVEFYGVQHGPGLQAFMAGTWPDFRKALDALLKGASGAGGDVPGFILRSEKADPEALAWAGGFALLAHQLGLIDGKGAIPERLEPMVRVLYRYRIAQGMRGSLNPLELLSIAEIRALDLWRLHEATRIPIDRRLSYIERLGRLLPPYPGPLARGVAHHQNGDDQKARAAFLEVAQSHPEWASLADAYLDLLPPATP